MENQDEKTEEPTSRKLDKAREKGDVPKSQEVNSLAILMASFCSIWLFGSYFQQSFLNSMKETLGNLHIDISTVESIRPIMKNFVLDTFIISGPFLAISFVTALAVGYMQIGWLWQAETMKIDFKKILPKPEKLKDMLFSAKSAAELFKSILKVFVMGWITYTEIKANFFEFIPLGNLLVEYSMSQVLWLTLIILWKIFLAVLVLAVFDHYFQHYQHRKKNKMTKKEVKDEHKDVEGNPEIKSRRRSKMRQIFWTRVQAAVEKADVIVTNPTHISVALRYDPDNDPAPIILCMGKEHRALKIREIAQQKGIPRVENKPLARSLFFNCKEGEMIPPEMFVTVAELLTYVYQLKGDENKLEKATGNTPRA